MGKYVSASYLDLQGTCSEKLVPAPQPEPVLQASAHHPTSTQAAEMDRPSYSLKNKSAMLFASVIMTHNLKWLNVSPS